ncbi:MAG: TAXI family TRAP transporter solute-binding subunit [Planctomycetaceae bacterium]
MLRSVLKSLNSSWLVLPLALAVCLSLPGCGGGGGESKNEFISIGTAGQGGAFYQVGAAIANVMNEHKDIGGWKKVTAEETGGSLENLRRLESGDIQIGMTNSSISYLAASGKGSFDKKYKVKSVMTLFPLIAMFVTKADSGITSIKQLEGKRVVVGPEGAGFEHFVRPILEEHGVKWDSIEKRLGSFTKAVGYLQDGSADAVFLGGGRKSPAITSAATSMDIRLIPYDDDAKKRLMQKFPSFSEVVVPAKTYKGQAEDYNGLNVGSAQLLVREDASDEFVTNVIKAIWKGRKKIAQAHAAGKSINPKNVGRFTGVEFHPAAKKLYESGELEGWPKAETKSASKSE